MTPTERRPNDITWDGELALERTKRLINASRVCMALGKALSRNTRLALESTQDAILRTHRLICESDEYLRRSGITPKRPCPRGPES
jgi:hypothetical protein